MGATFTVASPQARVLRSPRDAVRGGPVAPASHKGASPAIRPRHGRGGRVLFEVPFTSEMSDADLARLARVLDLSTHLHPKQRPDPTSPGVARLDHFSGLYLEPGDSDGEWVLEARTWGKPAPESVHEWHLLAVDAARELDPTVTSPERLPASATPIHDRLVGEVNSRRFADFRRHLTGLP